MMSKIAVIIPAFNEALSIGQVVEALPNQVNEVIVVDNNSTDTTQIIAKEKGATVLFEPKKGYGYACLKGVHYLASDPPEIVVFLDGDYSDFPEDLNEIVTPIINKEARFVMGSRTKELREKGGTYPTTGFWKWLGLFFNADTLPS